ncbi:hypothetical protein J2T20_003287 [Paenibacillus wynnii]|nr:hypothetical protein [Paenibacillus wynnii]
MKGKLYAVGVINELKRLGYTEIDAKRVFLQHYRGLNRNYGLNMNVHDFANVIDEIERLIYVGHIRDQLLGPKNISESTGMDFHVSGEMEQKINEWDSCKPEDVTGAKLAYIFIPTGFGLVVKVQCDVCKRELDLSDW